MTTPELKVALCPRASTPNLIPGKAGSNKSVGANTIWTWICVFDEALLNDGGFQQRQKFLNLMIQMTTRALTEKVIHTFIGSKCVFIYKQIVTCWRQLWRIPESQRSHTRVFVHFACRLVRLATQYSILLDHKKSAFICLTPLHCLDILLSASCSKQLVNKM